MATEAMYMPAVTPPLTALVAPVSSCCACCARRRCGESPPRLRTAYRSFLCKWRVMPRGAAAAATAAVCASCGEAGGSSACSSRSSSASIFCGQHVFIAGMWRWRASCDVRRETVGRLNLPLDDGLPGQYAPLRRQYALLQNLTPELRPATAGAAGTVGGAPAEPRFLAPDAAARGTLVAPDNVSIPHKANVAHHVCMLHHHNLHTARPAHAARSSALIRHAWCVHAWCV